MMTRIKLHNKRQKRRRLEMMHTRCQKIARGFICRRRVIQFRRETRLKHVSAAKRWKQLKEEVPIPPEELELPEDERKPPPEPKITYVSMETGETVTEPPPEGFTDVDGNLHLASGEFVANPLLAMTEEQRAALAERRRCSECEANDASRLCDQCGDQFCASCWPLVHDSSEARKRHTFTAINKPECCECLQEYAERHCDQCDEDFCENCFANIHKGKVLSRHTWSRVEETEIDYGIY